MALTLCDECSRHVRESEPACPFCGCVRSVSEDVASPEAPSRLSRAAILLAGAMSVAACERNPLQREPQIAQPYGAPPRPPTPDVVEAPQPATIVTVDAASAPESAARDAGSDAEARDARRASAPVTRRPVPRMPIARPLYGAPIAAYGGPPGEFKPVVDGADDSEN